MPAWAHSRRPSLSHPLLCAVPCGVQSTTTWDESRIYGCVCDSSWSVGFDSGETQEVEYFGVDCSLRHCPTGDDPITDTITETDCEGVHGGAAGNLCHVDCSNRGVCDYKTGRCLCFDGFFDYNCA